MAISKRLRYEILKRDSYACRYCGAKAPEAVLTVDHVTPAALGGTDTPDNLVAACKDCNSGKSSTSPDAPTVADVSATSLQWAADVREALGDIEAAERKVSDTARNLVAYWEQLTWPLGGLQRYPIPPDAWETFKRFQRYGLSEDAITTAIDRAVYITPGIVPSGAFRYCCGICWQWIREAEDMAARRPR
jgi:hypothetical protein